jgi:hypothetical protein
MKHLFSRMLGRIMAGLLFFLCLTGPMARAQAPAWQLAIAASGSSFISPAYGVGTDAAGNVYIGGSFQGTVGFGSTTLTSVGVYDLFVAKWNPTTAAFDWAVRTGGAGNDRVNAVAVSSSGIYLAGYTQSTILNFGPSTLGPNNGTDAFVAKITSAGNFVWALAVSSNGFDEALALAATGSTVYLGGHSTGTTLAFGTLSVANAGTINSGTDDGFVAKITDGGTNASYAWARGVGGTANDAVQALAVAGPDVLVAGSFGGTGAFGATSLSSAGFQDAFVGRLQDNGTSNQWAWVQRAGGSTGDEVATGVAVRGSRVYVAGYFDSSTAAFGATTLTRAGDYDVFVAELADAGNSGSFGWALRAGGTNDDRAMGLVATPTGVCVAGYSYSATASFGPTALVNYSGGGSADIFVARVVDNGSTGSFIWALRAGGTRDDQAFGLAISGSTIYIAGTVTPQAIFAPLVINSPTGTRIPLLAALSDPTLLAATSAQRNLTFTLVPNPARAATSVQLPTISGATTATLTLVDALGRTLRTATVQLPAAGLRHELDLGGLAPGLYAVQVQAGGTVGTQQLAVE